MDYLTDLRDPVERLQIRMQKTQFNLSEIKRITASWLKQPLFERKDGKKDSVLCLNERASRVAKRYGEIESASETVHRLFLSQYWKDETRIHRFKKQFLFNLFYQK